MDDDPGLPRKCGFLSRQFRRLVLEVHIGRPSRRTMPFWMPGIVLLAHFADFMLLSGLLFVNIALIQSRRKYPDRERLFRVPWVPWTTDAGGRIKSRTSGELGADKLGPRTAGGGCGGSSLVRRHKSSIKMRRSDLGGEGRSRLCFFGGAERLSRRPSPEPSSCGSPSRSRFPGETC